MDQFDTALFAGIQKSNYLDVHERYALHIKPNRGAFDAGLFPQFLEMFRSNSPQKSAGSRFCAHPSSFRFSKSFVSLITFDCKLPAISN
jgi:hypothetical protein